MPFIFIPWHTSDGPDWDYAFGSFDAVSDENKTKSRGDDHPATSIGWIIDWKISDR